MKQFFLFILFCMACYACFAQKVDSLRNEIKTVLNEIIEADNSEKSIPENTLRHLERLYRQAKTVHYQKGTEGAGIYLMKQYLRRGAYQKVIETGNDLTENIAAFHNETTGTELHRMAALAYSNLGFHDKSLEEYSVSIQEAAKVKDDDLRHYLLAMAYENITSYFEYTKQHLDSIPYFYIKSIQEAEAIKDSGTTLPSNYKFNAILYGHKDLADYYTRLSSPPQPALAEKEIRIALQMNEQEKGKIMNSNKVSFLATLCRIYLMQGQYDKAIVSAQEGLLLEKGSPSSYDKIVYYEILAKSYLAKNDKELSARYMNLYSALNDSLNAAEKMQTSATVRQMVSHQQKLNSHNIRQIMTLTGSLVIVGGFAVFLIWKKDRKTFRRKYEELLIRLKTEKVRPHSLIAESKEWMALHETKPGLTRSDASNTHQAKVIPPVMAGHRSSAITDETLSKLMAKLEKFEHANQYLKADINLTYLAHYLGTNQTYLSELLKTHRGKTYTNYINELKINYITQKLYEDPLYRQYKITHLAEECGFASRQVFLSVFKKVTGMTPSYYIGQLKDEES